MMCSASTRIWAGKCFLLLFLVRIGAGEVHHLRAHHEHERALACKASTGERHWHDERYAAHDCLLCALSFVTASLPENAPGIAVFPVVALSALLLADTDFDSEAPSCVPAPRGPPVVG